MPTGDEPDAQSSDVASAGDASAQEQATMDTEADRIARLPTQEALARVAVLGRSSDPGAASTLLAIAEGAGPKELRKEARRGLHRLRARGLDVPRPVPPPAPRVVERRAQLVEARATSSDGVGSRALWLLAEGPYGGVHTAAMVLNEIVGLKACDAQESSRKRALAAMERWQQRQVDLTWVDLPLDYARQLLGEALALNHESGFTLPREYQAYQRAVPDLVRPFEQALVYQQIPRAEVALRPDLLDESPAILEESECKAWFFGYDEVQKFAQELVQARRSPIVLSEDLRTGREARIASNALLEIVMPTVQRGLQRRLEEIAYVFSQTNRLRLARLAVAAAVGLSHGAVSTHPVLRSMMERSLTFAEEVEKAEIPVDLVRRSAYDPIT